jgi:uncharacterized membrane protein YdjX (TVP38/TMEM64 family)
MEGVKNKNKFKFLLLISFLFLLWYLGRLTHIDTESLRRSFKGVSLLYSGIIYILLYVIITFFIFFSKDIFWIQGALVFGPYLSASLIYIAEIINAVLLFHLARLLGRNFVERHLKEKSEKLDEKLANINFFWLFIIRFVPLVPYRFLDLGAGLTSISFRKYLLVVLLATPIRALWVQYILSVVGRNIFNKPQLLIDCFINNRLLLTFSFIYLILVILAAVKLKTKHKLLCL